MSNISVEIPLKMDSGYQFVNINLDSIIPHGNADILRAYIDELDEKLFDLYKIWSKDLINGMLKFPKKACGKCRFIYRITFPDITKGKFIVFNGVERQELYVNTNMRNFNEIAGIYHFNSYNVLNKFILLKIIFDFYNFYCRHGRVFPAYIEIDADMDAFP